MSVLRTALALALLSLAACAAPRPLAERPSPPKPAPRASAETLRAISEAQAKVSAAKRVISGYVESDAALAEARSAAATADNPRAQTAAREAQSRAALALDGHYLAASAQRLQELYSVTGLSDAQMAQLRSAEVALVRGEGAQAYNILQKLTKDVKSDKKHQVRSGESLWSISARPEVYSNGFLWPLIWEANKDKIKDPNVLYKGQTLRIKPNPTVDEVVRAVEYARARLGARVRVGEVKEAP